MQSITYKALKSAGKPKIHLLPAKVIREIAEIITEGSEAHNGENWLICDPKEYIDALGRHLLNVMQDVMSVNKDDGPGTRLNAAYLAANAVILLDIINNIPQPCPDVAVKDEKPENVYVYTYEETPKKEYPKGTKKVGTFNLEVNNVKRTNKSGNTVSKKRR